MGITSNDLVIIGFLIFLEGILSIDNALVLAVLARHLPKDQQKKALTYGLLGAFIFRLIALAMVTYLAKWVWVKYVGGGYLIYIAVKHLFFGGQNKYLEKKVKLASFWRTVVAIELTDIAFAVDSILAGVALTPKIWIVFTGGVFGIVLMRFAAAGLIRMLDKFPRLEKSAYLLVLIIGIKVIAEAIRIPGVDFHSTSRPSFWIYWVLMAACVTFGFIRPAPGKKLKKHA